MEHNILLPALPVPKKSKEQSRAELALKQISHIRATILAWDHHPSIHLACALWIFLLHFSILISVNAQAASSQKKEAEVSLPSSPSLFQENQPGPLLILQIRFHESCAVLPENCPGSEITTL